MQTTCHLHRRGTADVQTSYNPSQVGTIKTIAQQQLCTSSIMHRLAPSSAVQGISCKRPKHRCCLQVLALLSAHLWPWHFKHSMTAMLQRQQRRSLMQQPAWLQLHHQHSPTQLSCKGLWMR
jgi:hypothetical protein